jgi:hypothetical protein
MIGMTTSPPYADEVLAAIKQCVVGLAEGTGSAPERSAADMLSDALADCCPEEMFESAREEFGSTGEREAAKDFGCEFFDVWVRASPPEEAATIIADVLRDPDGFVKKWDVGLGDIGPGFAEGFLLAAESLGGLGR